MTPIETVLGKLSGAKRSGKGWTARCPAHEDRRASLSIAEGEDGRCLIACHAGCSAEAVVTAMDMTLRDLMAAATHPPARNGKPKTNTGPTFPSLSAALAELEKQHGKSSMRWTYHDSEGAPVGVVVRWDRTDGKKDIRPVSRCSGGWRIEAISAPRPLYGFTALTNANVILVVEGEKAADAARSIGLTATTSAGGAQAPQKTDWRPLAGKEVWILPDNDEPGRKYAATVAAILAKLSPPAVVRIVELPDLPAAGDIVEWINGHGDAAEPDVIRAHLERLASAVEPSTGAKPLPGADEPFLVTLSTVEPVEVDWLWQSRIPIGRIIVLAGRPGCGKSMVSLDMAARVTHGRDWPDGSSCPLGSVLILAAEDNLADTVRPRLDAARADANRVVALQGIRMSHHDGSTSTRSVTLADLTAIETALERMPDCRLVIVDPIGSYLGGGTDSHRDNEVRAVLAPLGELADRREVAVVVVCHTRKSGSQNFADDAILGSVGFTGIARSVLHVLTDPDDQSRRRKMLLPGKCNLAAPSSGWSFTVEGNPPRIVWGDRIEESADSVIAAASQPGPQAEQRRDARDWLLRSLADGPRPAKELQEEATHGEGISTATLKRAKKEAGVMAFRPENPGPWWWRLPGQAEIVPEADAHDNDDDPPTPST